LIEASAVSTLDVEDPHPAPTSARADSQRVAAWPLIGRSLQAFTRARSAPAQRRSVHRMRWTLPWLLALPATAAALHAAPSLGDVSVSAQGTTACRTNVRLAAVTNRTVYSRGRPVAITVTARNRGRSPCELATGSCVPQVVITSAAGAEVWNRAAVQVVCVYGKPRRLAPGAAATRTVTWNGRRCAARDPASCPLRPVSPGRYRVSAGWETTRHASTFFVER
jgi:hypothetical protein